MTRKSLLPSPKPEVTDQQEFSDQDIEKYMHMAARMLYDILRDWREGHQTAETHSNPNAHQSEGKKNL